MTLMLSTLTGLSKVDNVVCDGNVFLFVRSIRLFFVRNYLKIFYDGFYKAFE